jgi:carboxylate-amine ligase
MPLPGTDVSSLSASAAPGSRIVFQQKAEQSGRSLPDAARHGHRDSLGEGRSRVGADGRSSVADHRFGSSEPYTLGLEEEYMLLDPETFALVQRADMILEADDDSEFAARTTCEIFQSEIEGQTPICATVDEAAIELRRLRGHLEALVGERGFVLGSAGTHPFGRYEDQVLTDRARYRGIVEQVQYPARRELVFGLHIHVGVSDPETAIQVVRALRLHIPELIALSASSPFWRGLPSGLRSTRHSVFDTFPRSGPPPAFDDWGEFVTYVEALERAGMLEDFTRIWWDVRPHPRFGTVEVRAMDAVERVEDAVALAAYVQALVKRAAEGPRLSPSSALEGALLRENKWQAIRYGLEAAIVGADAAPTPIRSQILRTLDELSEAASELDSDTALLGIEQIVRAGTGAERQLAVFAATADIRAVTRMIAAETRGAGARA